MQHQPFRMTVMTNPIGSEVTDAWLAGVESLWLQMAVEATFKGGLASVTGAAIQATGMSFPLSAVDALNAGVIATWNGLKSKSTNLPIFLQEARTLFEKFLATATPPVQQPSAPGPIPTPTPGAPIMNGELDIQASGIIGTLVLMVIFGIVAISFTQFSR
jgi:hypothetical protein